MLFIRTGIVIFIFMATAVLGKTNYELLEQANENGRKFTFEGIEKVTFMGNDVISEIKQRRNKDGSVERSSQDVDKNFRPMKSLWRMHKTITNSTGDYEVFIKNNGDVEVIHNKSKGVTKSLDTDLRIDKFPASFMKSPAWKIVVHLKKGGRWEYLILKHNLFPVAFKDWAKDGTLLMETRYLKLNFKYVPKDEDFLIPEQASVRTVDNSHEQVKEIIDLSQETTADMRKARQPSWFQNVEGKYMGGDALGFLLEHAYWVLIPVLVLAIGGIVAMKLKK